MAWEWALPSSEVRASVGTDPRLKTQYTMRRVPATSSSTSSMSVQKPSRSAHGECTHKATSMAMAKRACTPQTIAATSIDWPPTKASKTAFWTKT